MKKLSNTSKINKIMSRKLLKYQGAVNRVTYQLRWNYSARNFYSDDNANFIPDPVECCARNSNLKLYARQSFMVNVDWGDGSKEQFQSAQVGTNNHVVTFRSLMYQYDKAPGSNMGASGYYGIPPHHYADDDKNTLRTVVIEATAPIYSVIFSTFVLNVFPIVESESLLTLEVSEARYISSVPYDSFSHIPNLESLKINSGVTRIQNIPESIFELKKIKTLAIENALDIYDIEASGVRRIKELTSLTHLNLGANYLPKYIKEFNEMPNLTTLRIFPGNFSGRDIDRNDCPIMDEVAEVASNIKTFEVMSYRDSRSRYPDFSGVDISRCTAINSFASLGSLTTDFPLWLRNARSISQMSTSNTFRTQERLDAAVESFYSLVTGWEYITMSQTASDGGRNQFYGFSWNLNSSVYPGSYFAPSGTDQAPSGFEKGVSNGTPASPMEMLYALRENYNMKFYHGPAKTT